MFFLQEIVYLTDSGKMCCTRLRDIFLSCQNHIFLTPRVLFQIGFRSRRTNIKIGSVVAEPLSAKDKQTIVQSQLKSYKNNIKEDENGPRS